MKHLKIISLLVLLVSLSSCWKYSFTGISIAEGTETFQVNYFQNNAPLNEPGLDRDFTLLLQDLIQNQSNLTLVKTGGDLIYEGEIVEYRISPMTSTSANTAAQNRLTIGVNVRFFDTKNPDNDFERRFSFYFDYPASAQLVGAQKATATEEILDRITQDIFNASLANW